MSAVRTSHSSWARRAVLPTLLVVALAVLWAQVELRGPVVRLDLAARARVLAWGDGPVVQAADVLTDLANPASSVALLVAVGAAAAAARRSWQPVVLVLTAVALLSGTVLTLKHVVGLVGPRGDSSLAWPSGHTTTAVVVAGVLLSLAPPTWRRVGAAVAAAYGVAVGLALVLATYHWVSDVVAGWLLGPLILLAARAVTARLTGPLGPAAGRRATSGRRVRRVGSPRADRIGQAPLSQP